MDPWLDATSVTGSGRRDVRKPQGEFPTASDVPLEDRFTDLAEERNGLGMTGFKESLLTRVLCIVEPNRFLPILVYTSPSGGKEIAASAWALDLPPREKVSWTIGRLVTWSNDLLVDLLPDVFDDLGHAAAFLWWAKGQPAGAAR